MPDFLSARIHCHLGPRGIALWRADGWMRPRLRPLASFALQRDADCLPQLTSALPALLDEAGCRNVAMHVSVDDTLARLFMVTPPANAASLTDCRAAAQARLMQLYGETAAGDALSGDWDHRHPFLACALPARLVDLAHEGGVRVLSLTPHGVAAWNRWRHQVRAGHWFASVAQDQLTLMAVKQGRVHALRTLPLPEGGWHADGWLAAQVRREALRWGLETPPALHACGLLPGHDAVTELDGLSCLRLGGPGQEPDASGLPPPEARR